MRIRKLISALVIAAWCFAALAQDEWMSVDELGQAAQEWAEENLDPEVLKVLQSGDQQKVEQLFQDMQKRSQGEYVVDMAALKTTARTLLPLLESHEETLPYAIWLKTRLDYMDVAEYFRATNPPPKSEPGQPPKPAPNPPPQEEREIWVNKLAQRPWPKAAQSYVPKLKAVFAEEKVPAELVWVAEVESSFDPRAKSPVGAAGLFQLMPATAKQYGLSRWPFDQRYKPVESGRAAAKYLSSLHRRFKDWRLALAAYNAGEGTVQRLMAKHKAQTFDALSTHLPAETQMYVPKVEATILKREGVKLTELKG
jgi:membrane-bound lytic murein transglycosylase D